MLHTNEIVTEAEKYMIVCDFPSDIGHRITAALANGWKLFGLPANRDDGQVFQAIIKQ